MEYEEIAEITARFDDCERLIPAACLNVHHDSLPLDLSFMAQPRLLRAAANQAAGDPSALSRYHIWAETLRGAVVSAVNDLADGAANEDTRRNLIRVANSLAAFCEVCARTDPGNA